MVFLELQAKREAALAYLGDRWIFHPQYRSEKHPHHALSVRTATRLAIYCRIMQQRRDDGIPLTLPVSLS
jgi:hypothetical protein